VGNGAYEVLMLVCVWRSALVRRDVPFLSSIVTDSF
jgi:hypothetical protein